MKKMPEVTYWLSCDDVRQEVNGKITLVGVYGEDILLPSLPQRMPQYCILMFISNFTESNNISFRIESPKGEKIASLELAPPPDKKQETSRALIYLSPWEWKEAGKYKLIAKIGDSAEKIFGHIDVKLATPSK
jgi:hypothetical protein